MNSTFKKGAAGPLLTKVVAARNIPASHEAAIEEYLRDLIAHGHEILQIVPWNPRQPEAGKLQFHRDPAMLIISKRKAA